MKTDEPAVNWREFLATVLAVGVALLPRLTCPCQFPAYASLLASMGLAFLTETLYLFPLTAVCLTLVVGGLAIQAGNRWGLGPFYLGCAAALLLVIGKFVVVSPALVNGGIAGLVAASVWNALPRKPRTKLQFNPDGSLSLPTRPRGRAGQHRAE